MVWRAGGCGGAGKGRTFFSVWFIAFLGPGGSPPGAAWLGRARTGFTARVGPDCTSAWLRVGYLRGPWLASLSAVAVFGAGSCCAPRRSSLSAPRSRDARGGAPTFCPLGGHPLHPQQRRRRRPGGARVSKLSYGALVAGLRTRLYLRWVSVGFWFEGNREDRAVGPAAQPHSCAFPWDLPFRTHRGMTVCDQRRGRKQHADGDEIPSPSRTGGTGLPVRRLARVLAGRLGQTPDVLPGDAGEGQTLTCVAPTVRLRYPPKEEAWRA